MTDEIEEAILNMPVGIFGPERDKYIIEHATFYTISFRKNNKHRHEYQTLEAARFNAGIAANFLKRDVIIYAVLGYQGLPDTDPKALIGYPALVEVVRPEK